MYNSKLKHVKLFENFDVVNEINLLNFFQELQSFDAAGVTTEDIKKASEPQNQKKTSTNNRELKSLYNDLGNGIYDEDPATLVHELRSLLENNSSDLPWFQAEDKNGKFKFQATDIDEATEYANTKWSAKVIGEVTEDMEFEDLPMDDESKVNEGSYTDFLTSQNKTYNSSKSKPERLGWVSVREHKPTPLTQKSLSGVIVKTKELKDHRQRNGEQAILVP